MDKKEIKELNNIKVSDYMIPQQTHFDNDSNSKNVLLISMSTLPAIRKSQYYCFIEIDGKPVYRLFTGESQLEPGTKLFISKLAEQGLKADKIIVLTTPETWEPKYQYDKKSAVDVYACNIGMFLSNGKDKENIEIKKALKDKLDASGLMNSRQIIKANYIKELYKDKRKTLETKTKSKDLNRLKQYIDIKHIDMGEDSLQKLMKELNDLALDNHVNLFIDLQGGSRTFMFTMFAACTLLRDRNITVRDMMATRYEPAYTVHPIEILNREYAIIDLVSGIRSFSGYGKVGELKQFLTSRNLKNDSEENKLIEAMERIDGCMQINNPEGFTRELDNMVEKSMFDLEKYFDPQFKLIVNDLKEEYYPLIKKGHTILDQIKWFGNKGLITSALTFIEDKMPDFLVNNSKFPVIKVEYDPSLTSKQIAYLTSGQYYYRPNNNIFNSGLETKLIRTLKNRFYKDLCWNWTRKIIGTFKGTYNLNIGSSIEKYGLSLENLTYNEELRSSLLEVEDILGDEVWKPLKLTFLYGIVTKGSMEWTDFKDEKGIKSGKQKHIIDENLSRSKILEWFLDTESQTEARLAAILEFLKYNECIFDLSDNNYRIIIENVLSIALFNVVFFDNIPNARSIKDIIKPLLGRTFSVLNNINVVPEEEDSEKLVITYSNGYDTDLFKYDFWRELVVKTSSGVTMDMLNGWVSDNIVTEEKIKEAERKLIIYSESMKQIEYEDTDSLIEFAKQYNNCCQGKRALRFNTNQNVYEEECSYKNMQMYSKLGSRYIDLYSKYFYIDNNGICLDSTAGIKDGYYQWFDFSISEPVKEKRILLDLCIRFYKVFRIERNATNHAEGIDFYHMDYRCTRKAIQVFVELFNRLVSSL